MTKLLLLLTRARTPVRDERAFTLIELLVVILIIGILAAIALPTFIGNEKKAQDTQAITSVRTALTAARSYFEEHDGYMGMAATDLVDIESGLSKARNLQVLGPWSKTQMALSVDSPSGTTFYIYDNSWSPNGAPVAPNGIDRWCNQPGKGACRPYGVWGAWGAR